MRFKRKRKIANAKIYEDKRDLYCMGPYIMVWVDMRPYIMVWVALGPCIMVWVAMGPYIMVWVDMDPYIMVWVARGPYIMVPYYRAYVLKLCPYKQNNTFFTYNDMPLYAR